MSRNASGPDAKGPDAAPAGLFARVRAAYWDFSSAARRVLDENPGDIIVLSFLLVVGLLRFVGLTVGGILALGHADPGLMQARLLDNMLFLPVGIYVFSLVVDILLRAFGGTGDWSASRLAIAWSLVVATPSVLGLAIIDGITRAGGDATDPSAAATHPLLGAVALALFGLAAYIVSAGLAAAHGFRSPLRLLAGLIGGIALLVAFWIGANYVAAQFAAA